MRRPRAAGRDELRALLVLDQLPGVGPRRIRAVVEAFGSASAGLDADFEALARIIGPASARARADPRWARKVDAGLDQADRLRMEVVDWGRATYPEVLLRLADPPPVLFLRGRPTLLAGPAAAVVGARRSTTRGKDVGRALGRRLARADVCVVSGMALGVDAAAHSGALGVGGPTIAVVGRGADAAYPASHRRLFERLVRDGLVVSEFLPGTPPLPHHFPRRNRIMAALARSVAVVEAGARSGALITVEHALDLGWDVWAVPGPIDTGACAGSNRLLEEGALPLVSLDRFVASVVERAGGGRWTNAGEGEEGHIGHPRSETERRILSMLVEGPLHIDDLAARARVDVSLALALLVQLELDGVVEQMPGCRFRAA